MDPRTIVLEEINYFSSIYLSDEQNLKGVCLLGLPTLSPFGKDVNPPGPQTYEEICIRGLTLFVTHSKKKKKKRGILGMLGPSDLLLSVR